jgi:hypothetical protein
MPTERGIRENWRHSTWINLQTATFSIKLDDLEEPSVVKIYTEIIRRKYKRRYTYSKYLVPVSARYNELAKPVARWLRLRQLTF